jgi:hypothetical protein
MMLKATAPKTALLSESTYPSALKSVTGLPEKENPKKVALGFGIEGHETEVVKVLPASFDAGKPLTIRCYSVPPQRLPCTNNRRGSRLQLA